MRTGTACSLAVALALWSLGYCATESKADSGAVPPRPSRGCAVDSIERGHPLNGSIEVGGARRAYILDVPASVQAHVPAPLVLDFHGFGGSARDVWRASTFHESAARDGAITVYPDGLPVHLLGRDAPGWQITSVDGNRDLAFTTALLDRLERDYCIDEARVFATGFSNGGFFSHLLGCTMADRFAAVAPVGGGMLTACAPSRAVPVLIHHGRNDPIVPVEDARKARDTWLAIDQCRQPSQTPPDRTAPPQDGHAAKECERHRGCRDGVEVIYCENDGTHHWPAAANERIWSFFRAHPMGSGEPVSR